MQDPFDIWMQTLQTHQRPTDVEWRNTIVAEMQKDTPLQQAEQEELRKLFEEAMGRSEALHSMQIQRIIAVAPSDPSSDNVPDRCKAFVEIRGEWVRPANVDQNDPKLWSKLASSLVRDTLDSTLVVISTDPRRTAKAAGGRKVEMYCRCAGKNKAKEGKRKARQPKPKQPPIQLQVPDAMSEGHAALYGTALFEPATYAHAHPLVIDATGQQALLQQDPHHGHRGPQPDQSLMQPPRMVPDGLSLDQQGGELESESLDMQDEPDDSDKLADDGRSGPLVQKCLARAILLLDVADDRSAGSFTLKVHLMHTHRCKHIVVGHARKEIDHCRAFMDSLISSFDSVSKALRKRNPDPDLVEAACQLRSQICLPRGPLNQSKMVYFLRQFTGDEYLKQVSHQARAQALGLADAMQLMDDPNRRRKRSNSNLYQDNFQDMYGQDARRVRSNSASSGGMLTGQMHPQMGLLTGAPDGSAGPISDSLLDDQHMQPYHVMHHQMDREVQDPQAAWVWTLMNSPQVQASGQTVQPVIEALRRGQGNPHQLNVLSSLIQNQGLEDLQLAVADSLKSAIQQQQYPPEGLQDVNHGWVNAYPAQHPRVDDREDGNGDQSQQLPKDQNADHDIIEATSV